MTTSRKNLRIFLKNWYRIKRVVQPTRLKIAEQILIVLFIAVLIPMIISGIIINNINQQAMRRELQQSAQMIAKVVSDEIDVFSSTTYNQLDQINATLSYFTTEEGKQDYLKSLNRNFPYLADLKMVNTQSELNKLEEKNKLEKRRTFYITTKDHRFLALSVENNDLNEFMFKSLKDNAQQIYILDKNKNLISEHNYSEDLFNKSVKLLPENLIENSTRIYGDKKNQPFAYIYKPDNELIIIVSTTEKITNDTINDNRFKLLLAVFISSLSIFILVALYVYYMYINIRQLFKGIIAISKGSYERRIRLLKSVFTPFEVVFLASEFNKMASEIHKSYVQLKEQNIKLEQLNEFRSNLIDTVSHELRTPLTSIQGYTSRLLRTDIEIDKETQQKSLRVIKRQSERLKRLIEDLLVIPDIERDRIRVSLEPVWIATTVENAMTLVKNSEEKEIINKVSEDFPLVIADKDRAEQVVVNLLENAIKYSKEDTPIIISGEYHAEKATITISNQCDKIPEETLETLFEKFIRMDDKTTRTTRGTGLGLFIVKGLVEAMEGEIKISSTDEVGFKVDITFPLFKKVTLKP